MKASGFGHAAVVLGAWLSTGCGMAAAESAFEADFSCANAAAEETNAAGRYRVSGCGPAPISPGSSGGGLCDARGNLIGMTTLVLVGREHLNQSLNFAIPAHAYFDTPVGKAQF